VGGSVGLGEGEVSEGLVECLEMLLSLLEEDGRREVQDGVRYMSFDIVVVTKTGPYARNTGGPQATRHIAKVYRLCVPYYRSIRSLHLVCPPSAISRASPSTKRFGGCGSVTPFARKSTNSAAKSVSLHSVKKSYSADKQGSLLSQNKSGSNRWLFKRQYRYLATF
jgi:hypothetical protein